MQKKKFCYVIDGKNLCVRDLYKICLCEMCQPYTTPMVTKEQMCPIWSNMLKETKVGTLTFIPKGMKK